MNLIVLLSFYSHRFIFFANFYIWGACLHDFLLILTLGPLIILSLFLTLKGQKVCSENYPHMLTENYTFVFCSQKVPTNFYLYFKKL